MATTLMNMVGPADSEPDCFDVIREFESIDVTCANVGSYDDWFPDAAESASKTAVSFAPSSM